MKRIRDKFKKYRVRSKDPAITADVERMKAKYGRKCPMPSFTLSGDAVGAEDVVKVQRMQVIKKLQFAVESLK